MTAPAAARRTRGGPPPGIRASAQRARRAPSQMPQGPLDECQSSAHRASMSVGRCRTPTMGVARSGAARRISRAPRCTPLPRTGVATPTAETATPERAAPRNTARGTHCPTQRADCSAAREHSPAGNLIRETRSARARSRLRRSFGSWAEAQSAPRCPPASGCARGVLARGRMLRPARLRSRSPRPLLRARPRTRCGRTAGKNPGATRRCATVRRRAPHSDYRRCTAYRVRAHDECRACRTRQRRARRTLAGTP